MDTSLPAPPRTRAGGALPPFAAAPVLAVAAGTVALLLLLAGRYGYHRDELYFLEASKHLAFGYVDQPPLSVLMVRLSTALFGASLIGLRVLPALADGAVVVLAALVARELLGGRFAQAFAALAIAVSAFLVAAHLAGPTIYDAAGWSAASLLILRILRTGKDRLWLAVGLVVGVSLQDKETILFLLFGLGVGLLLNRQARVFASPWLWLGGLIALAIWSPVLLWEARHGWPTAEMDRNLRAEHSGAGFTGTFPFIQLLLPNILLTPVWLSGLVALWREDRFRPYRSFAFAYALLFAVLLVTVPDRPYYLAPLYVLLAAAGAVVTEDVVSGERGFFRRRARRGVLWRSRPAAVALALVAGAVLLPIALPVLPARALATVPLQDVNYNLGENIGWQELVRTVASVYRSLPPATRRSAVIVTDNYGEAGAIDRYGGAYGLPGAFSGHNSYWWWGPPSPPSGVAIFVTSGGNEFLTRYFASVERVATIRNRWGVQNDEEGTPVWLCRGQRRPWPAIWPDFRHYG